MKLLSALAAVLVALPAAAQQPPPPPPSSPPPPPPTYAPPPPAAAPHGRPPLFLGVRVGLYRPSDDTTSQNFNDGVDFEGFIGVPLHEYVSLVGGIGYYKISTDTVSVFDPTIGNISGKLEVSAIPITASLRLGSAVDRFSFYGIAGVGLHLTTLDVSASAQGFSGSQSEDDNVFGWHLGAGVGLAITPKVGLGAELRQTWVEANYPNLLGDKLKLDGLRIGGVLTFTL